MIVSSLRKSVVTKDCTCSCTHALKFVAVYNRSRVPRQRFGVTKAKYSITNLRWLILHVFLCSLFIYLHIYILISLFSVIFTFYLTLALRSMKPLLRACM